MSTRFQGLGRREIAFGLGEIYLVVWAISTSPNKTSWISECLHSSKSYRIASHNVTNDVKAQ
jgi:hypothetical protein